MHSDSMYLMIVYTHTRVRTNVRTYIRIYVYEGFNIENNFIK